MLLGLRANRHEKYWRTRHAFSPREPIVEVQLATSLVPTMEFDS